jgi:phospholipid-transporting ATPase
MAKTEAGTRHVNFRQEDMKICDNRVTTSHYTLINFVPKNTFEQFSKPANLYFLFLSILQVLPEVTTTGQLPTILLPLVCIVCLNALKDALEDWRRHRSDREENERKVLTLKGEAGQAQLVESKWCDLRVGSIIVVKQNEFVPADMIILSSCDEEGHVNIETANLDGETNLKTKQAPKAAFELVDEKIDMNSAAKKVASMKCEAEVEPPNEFLYTFVGNVTAHTSGEPVKISLDEENVVLRGCKIKNVAWTLGAVVYTGRETKIMMNSKDKKGRKLSHLEKDVGKLTLMVFCVQLALCLTAAIASAIFETNPDNLRKRYLNLTDANNNPRNGWLILVIRFFTFIILFSNFIPISLLVSMSLVKLAQVFFFYADTDMIYQDIHCMPRTSDLNEELGQIEYIFSDKTGTLTCNVMDFRKFCVNGVTYGQGMTEIKRQVMLKQGRAVVDAPPPPPGARQTPHVDLIDNSLEDLLTSRTGQQYKDVKEFLLHLAVNHEVVPEYYEDKSLGYSASSPDEAALCYGARHFGFAFQGRDSSGITLQLADASLLKVKILATIKFNSARKRSSVIAQFQETDQKGNMTERLVLYCKGADSVIMARLAPQHQNSPETRKSLEILSEFAEDGLRTLCLASRDLTQTEVTTWLAKWTTASLATEGRQDKMDQVSDEIEKDLTMNGITGIEDRLQDDVGNTIVMLAKAGIKVWMLTGDKNETAINIGIATGLIEAKAGSKGERWMFSSSDFEENGTFQADEVAKKLKAIANDAREADKKGLLFESLVIDGKCLELALEPDNEMDFVAIARNCRTVICCRVSPNQKGAVVRLIKTTEKAITLAVGDGANDCNMIQSADVGIGIRGLEGLQAFNVCDYGISQFRFLQDLVLAHGRWCYRRIAILVNYMFYKNLVVVLPQYFLGCVSGFSGQKLYNDVMYQSYNVFHTALPIMFFAVLDQDVSKRHSLAYPQLYSAGHQKTYMNPKVSAGWLASGVWHSLVVFFVPYYTMSNGNITHSDGKANDIWLVGTVVFLLVCLVVNFQVVLETCYLNWLTLVGLCLSFGAWAIEQCYISGVGGSVVSSELFGSTQRLFGCPMLYLTILTGLALCLMVDIHLKGIRCNFFPTILHDVQANVLVEKRAASEKRW